MVQKQSTKKYSVGPALYRLGSVYSERKGIWDIASPVLKAISKITIEYEKKRNNGYATSNEENRDGANEISYRLGYEAE